MNRNRSSFLKRFLTKQKCRQLLLQRLEIIWHKLFRFTNYTCFCPQNYIILSTSLLTVTTRGTIGVAGSPLPVPRASARPQQGTQRCLEHGAGPGGAREREHLGLQQLVRRPRWPGRRGARFAQGQSSCLELQEISVRCGRNQMAFYFYIICINEIEKLYRWWLFSTFFHCNQNMFSVEIIINCKLLTYYCIYCLLFLTLSIKS